MQIILSIIGCLIIFSSELLPFIKSIKSNGIIDLIINSIRGCFTKKIQNIEESQPLLGDSDTNNRDFKINIQDESSIVNGKNDENYHEQDFVLLNTINNLNTNLCKISNKFDEYISKIDELQQFPPKVYQKDIYELEYIINYIKSNYPKKIFQTRFLTQSNKQILQSNGYIIDYDSFDDIYKIKW